MDSKDEKKNLIPVIYNSILEICDWLFPLSYSFEEIIWNLYTFYINRREKKQTGTFKL